MKTREELLEEARRSGLNGMDAYDAADDADSEQVSSEPDDTEGPPTAAEMKAAIGGGGSIDGPEYNPAALAPDDSAAAFKTGGGEAPVQTSAAPQYGGSQDWKRTMAEQLKRQLFAPAAERAPSALPEALRRDADTARSTRVSDYLRAAFTRRPVQFSPTDTNEADQVRAEESSQRLQDEAGARQKNATMGLLGKLTAEPKAGQAFDDPYHRALGDQANSLVDDRKRKAQEEFDKKKRMSGELEALRREAAKQLPSVDVSGLGAEDLRSLIRAKDAKERARILAAIKAAEKGEGKPLAPTALAELADADVAKKQVDGLAKTFSDLDMGSPTAKVSSFFTQLLGLQFTDAAKFDAESRRVQQAAGKILEGGKLAAGDETKYRNMLLKPGDAREIVAAKTAGMVDFLEEVKAGRIKVYRAGGYKVPESIDTPPVSGKTTPNGKPFAKKQVSPSTGRVRYLDATGAVIEESDG